MLLRHCCTQATANTSPESTYSQPGMSVQLQAVKPLQGCAFHALRRCPCTARHSLQGVSCSVTVSLALQTCGTAGKGVCIAVNVLVQHSLKGVSCCCVTVSLALQTCTDGTACKRRVCFFAHMEGELRKPEPDSVLLSQQLQAELAAGQYNLPRHPQVSYRRSCSRPQLLATCL